MVELDHIYVRSGRSKTDGLDPDRIIIAILDELGIDAKKASAAQKNQVFQAYVQRSREDLEIADMNATWNADYVWQRLAGRSRKSLAPPPTPESLAEKTERREKMLDAIKIFCIMDCILPTGKALRYSTGAECKAAGGLFMRIAAKIKPNQIVGKVLTDKEVQALWSSKP